MEHFFKFTYDSYDVALLINAIVKLQSSVGNIYIYHGKAHFLLFLVL